MQGHGSCVVNDCVLINPIKHFASMNVALDKYPILRLFPCKLTLSASDLWREALLPPTSSTFLDTDQWILSNSHRLDWHAVTFLMAKAIHSVTAK